MGFVTLKSELPGHRCRLILIEGRWWNGAGLERDETLRLVRRRGDPAAVTGLDDATLWGGPVSDDRYLVVSPP